RKWQQQQKLKALDRLSPASNSPQPPVAEPLHPEGFQILPQRIGEACARVRVFTPDEILTSTASPFGGLRSVGTSISAIAQKPNMATRSHNIKPNANKFKTMVSDVGLLGEREQFGGGLHRLKLDKRHGDDDEDAPLIFEEDDTPLEDE